MSTITTVRCGSCCVTAPLTHVILDKRNVGLFVRPNGRLKHVLTNYDYAYSHQDYRHNRPRCEPNPRFPWCDHPRAVVIMLGERTLFAGDSSQRDELFSRFLGDKLPGTTYTCHYQTYEADWGGHWTELPAQRLYI